MHVALPQRKLPLLHIKASKNVKKFGDFFSCPSGNLGLQIMLDVPRQLIVAQFGIYQTISPIPLLFSRFLPLFKHKLPTEYCIYILQVSLHLDCSNTHKIWK